MPDLPIAGPDGQLNPFVSQILLAITTYPDDEEKQRQAVASSVVSVIRQTENPDELMVAAVKQWPWLVESVWRAQPYDELWARLGKDMGPSWAAGELLITLLTAAIHHPEVEITITKAIDAVFRLHHGALTHGGGKAKATPRTLWNAWKRFRPVVHFHAVRRLYMLDYPERDFSDWFTSAVEEYLAAAEVVREQAVMRRFLPASGLWTVPKSLKLPKMEVELAPLTPELLDIIRSYKPEHSRDD